MKKREKTDLEFVFNTGLIIFLITIAVLIIIMIVSISSQNKNNEREGYAVITLDGYTDTIYFTKVDEFDAYYKFYLVDGSEVYCHRYNVVIYYDEEYDEEKE